MTHIGPLDDLPIACTLTPHAGKGQVARWRTFDEDYALSIDHADTEIVVHYAKAADSITRLRELVATESSCCSFVDWAIDESRADLRLIVTGSPERLAVLTITQPTPGA